MIPAILGLAAAFLSLAKVLVEKFVPSHVTKKRVFKSKKKMVDGLAKYRDMTIEQIAKSNEPGK
jgi:hypothetical protein